MHSIKDYLKYLIRTPYSVRICASYNRNNNVSGTVFVRIMNKDQST